MNLLRTFLPLVLVACAELLLPAAEPVLKLGKLPAGKVLFVGNSITLHGELLSIGWPGSWGMAATAESKDYVHLVTAKIARVTGAAPQIMVKNIADFERNYASFDVATPLKDALDFHPDIIILAIGENVPTLGDDAAKTGFSTAFVKLLVLLQKSGEKHCYVRSCFWADATKDGIMQKAASDARAVFVDISTLGKDESNYARSERKIENAGVGHHPGDKGMQAMADGIFAAIAKDGGIAE